MPDIGKVNLLGIWANAFTMDSMFEVIRDSINSCCRTVIGNHNLHSIYLYHHDAQMKAFFQRAAHYIFIDGMPVVLWGKLLGYPLTRSNRLTCVDWIPPLIELCAAEGWRVYYLGGQPGVAESGAQHFREQFPGLDIQTAHGYFSIEQESASVIGAIDAVSPDILMVGMGMPRQEHWILDHVCDLEVPCIITVGATMDYFAGAIPTPPRWTGRLGLEWLARLIAEPHRLGHRYLVEPWFLLPYMVADLRQRRRRQARR